MRKRPRVGRQAALTDDAADRPEDRIIVQVSADVEVILGVSAPDVLGTSLDDLMGKSQVDYLLKVARDGELQPMRWAMRLKNASTWAWMVISPNPSALMTSKRSSPNSFCEPKLS
ncbi:hypothetical protein [Asticcacaulis machinosus]|uniref:PAS fold-2 domain-containing protein n=1 Tax=Asticcacaulis machinosus TaxID=2984211 RepID=A0ABT5HIW4_9CAUL|nr:hypothetical protein [Asticcacaulis machinosus]MDC7676174.1 hypothetical protein [Asticcacaulis machinosus]